MDPRNALPLGFPDRARHLLRGLPLVEPVQNLLRARLHAKRQETATGLRMSGSCSMPTESTRPFAAPAKLQFALDHAPANALIRFRLIRKWSSVR